LSHSVATIPSVIPNALGVTAFCSGLSINIQDPTKISRNCFL
jgi:hypothetical protein